MSMRLLRRLFLGGSIRQIIDSIAMHTGHPQTESGLRELGFDPKDINKATESKYIEKYNFPIASFGIGENVTYEALRLTESGKKVSDSRRKHSETRANLLGWIATIISSVIAGLILAYVFGVGK